MRLMNQLSVFALITTATVGGVGCAGAAFIGRPVIGTTSLYASTAAREFINEQTRLGSKSAEGCVTSILGVVTTGDATASDAARKANISRITHVDHKFENILGIYAKYCVTVFGD
ncbi:MAG: TRL-like family protein [Cystobacter sp.]